MATTILNEQAVMVLTTKQKEIDKLKELVTAQRKLNHVQYQEIEYLKEQLNGTRNLYLKLCTRAVG